eukprot:2500733-Rhodomonas_salina.1
MFPGSSSSSTGSITGRESCATTGSSCCIRGPNLENGPGSRKGNPGMFIHTKCDRSKPPVSYGPYGPTDCFSFKQNPGKPDRQSQYPGYPGTNTHESRAVRDTRAISGSAMLI